MQRSKGFARSDLVACVAAGVVLASLASVLGQPVTAGPRAYFWKNLARIASATAQFQADHANNVPIVLSYRRGTVASPTSGSLEGLCGWAWGGKNNSSWWAGHYAFDVEAADRPMNQYLYPNQPFTAPAPPARLPADDPRRLEEAPVYRDLYGQWSRSRWWPAPTPGVTGYDDVGTSYLFTFAWLGTDPTISQLWSGGQAVAAIAEANRRIAQYDGVNPARFVWLGDQSVDVVPGHTSSNFKLTNGYGDVNKGAMLFLDGHASYEDLIPGVYSTPRYTLTFE